MNGHDDALRERLHDFLDGELTPVERARVARHLDACAACRQELAWLRDLVGRASALPEAVAPSRDLWPDVAARIAAPGPEEEAGGRAAPAQARRGIHRAWAWSGWLAAAAAALLLLLPARGPGPRRERSPDDAVRAPTAEALLLASLADLETGSREAQAMFAAALRRPGTGLAPQSAAEIQHGLAQIDRAIEETRAALAADPRDPGLVNLLASDYRSRIDLLRRAARLSTPL